MRIISFCFKKQHLWKFWNVVNKTIEYKHYQLIIKEGRSGYGLLANMICVDFSNQVGSNDS